MSKTLFNQNTFQSKNVTNSDDVSDLKVDTFKATDAVIKNLTNTELQTATTNIATNTSNILANANSILLQNGNIATNASNITTNANNITTNANNITTNTSAISANASAITTNATAITANTTAIGVNATAITTNATAIGANASAITANTTAIGVNATAITANTTAIGVNATAITANANNIALKQNILSEGTPLQIEVDSDEVSALLATSAGATNFGLITGNVLNTELSSKQDNVSGGDGITLAGTTLSVSQVLPNNHRVNGGFLVDSNSSSTSIIGIEDGFKVRSVGDSVDFSVLGGNTNITADLTVSGKISGTTVFEDFRTNGEVGTGNDFHIATRDTIDSAGNKDELVLTPSTGTGATSEDGKLHLGGYIDESTSTYTQTIRNHHYAGSHRFYVDHVQKYNFSNAYFNLINQTNDTTINNNLGDTDAAIYSNMVRCIRMGMTGNPGVGIGEGRGHYIGILNKGVTTPASSAGFIAFGRDGGGTPDPDIGLAIDPGGGSIYMAGEIRGYGRRGGRNLCVLFFNQNDAVGGSAGDGNYGGSDGNGARLTFNGNGKRIGDSFFTIGTGADSGILTLNKGGTYKISVNATVENAGINDRACFGLYVSKNDENDSTSLFQNTLGAGRFGITYTRDNNFGVSGNIAFHFYDNYNVGDNIRLKTKLGQGSDNGDYNDTTDDGNIDVFAKMEVEFIKGGILNNDDDIYVSN